jgi:TatD DNase family protein
MYIDTHCHLDDDRFNVDEVVNNFLRVGVSKVINVGCNLKTTQFAKDLSEKYESVYFASGNHPSDIDAFNDEVCNELICLAKHKKCVAIGEIGLDYHWEGFDKTKQIDAFIRQLEIAHTLKLPVSLHSRDATKDMMDILKSHSSILMGGVMHCFSGSKETAKEVMDLGLMIGFGGTVTFKNAKNVVEVADFCPVDYILTETDCPYLSPEPYRGQLNEPKNIPIILDKLSKIKNIENEKLCEIIMNNANRVFNLK